MCDHTLDLIAFGLVAAMATFAIASLFFFKD